MDYSAYSPSVNQNQKGWCLSKLINDRRKQKRKITKQIMLKCQTSNYPDDTANWPNKNLLDHIIWEKKILIIFGLVKKLKTKNKTKMTNTHTHAQHGSKW